MLHGVRISVCVFPWSVRAEQTLQTDAGAAAARLIADNESNVLLVLTGGYYAGPRATVQ